MKNYVFAGITTVLSACYLNAQNDLVVFNEGNERFYLYVNGIKQNANPESNVRVSNIKQPWVKVKVVFEDNKKIPDITANAQFVWEAEEKKGWEFVYQIVNKTGKYKLKPYSAAPINNDDKHEGQTVVNYSTTDAQPNVSSQPVSTPVQNSQTVTTTTVVTTNVPNTNTANGSANININISPTGAGIQIHDATMNNSSAGYTTTAVSTTVISSSSNSASQPQVTPQPQPVAIKCAVSDNEFQGIKKNISSKSFEDSKLTLAKQICDAKCLKSSQVRDIMKLFSFEETRLNFAKYAYNKVADKDNYYLVNEAFQFESSIEELNESIGK